MDACGRQRRAGGRTGICIHTRTSATEVRSTPAAGFPKPTRRRSGRRRDDGARRTGRGGAFGRMVPLCFDGV